VPHDILQKHRNSVFCVGRPGQMWHLNTKTHFLLPCWEF